MKGKRQLRPGEQALWDRVARTVTPLGERPAVAPEAGPDREPAQKGAVVKKANGVAGPAKPAKTRSPPEPGPLDRKERRKIAKGDRPIDGRIDLHGMTQEEAHAALNRFIMTAAATDKRLVLVITGKGQKGAGAGVLRRSVPHWLAQAPLRGLIVNVAEAHQAHGGGGALYVRLRAAQKRR